TGYISKLEDVSEVPQDIALSNFTEYDATTIPSSISLESKFPPVQSQGNYGTCVAWATGYNIKTALNGIEKGWGSAELARPENQTSPKSLFFNINSSDKGARCDGTSFEAALNVLITKGAATMSSVPYNNMGNCSGSAEVNSNNKIANYRRIAYNYKLFESTNRTEQEGMTKDNFKGYLAQGRPILFSARIGDRFTKWKDASVISSDTYNDPGGHAMVLVGYDDNKKAFRVRNSWGTNWGDNGSIWVDYDYFLTNWAKVAYVVQNESVPVSNGIENILEGYDLLAAMGEDYPDIEKKNSPRARAFSYEIYNSGKNTILASQNWSVLYMYYNATDANDFEIIYEDYYTDEFGSLGQHGKYSYSKALEGGTWNHMNVLSGKRAGEDEFPNGFELAYEMPKITGKYYLVVFADAYDHIKEGNEDNNFYFIGAAGGKPLDIKDGVLQSEPGKALVKMSAAKEFGGSKVPRAPATSVQEIGGSPNAYTPAEIRKLVLKSKENGILSKKIANHRENNNQATTKRHRNK
ncbi:MAG: C1 family peptidase, partial [Fibromonadales bacterium]|nr:C1 family peptidase [Fibromonadales bacterium]